MVRGVPGEEKEIKRHQAKQSNKWIFLLAKPGFCWFLEFVHVHTSSPGPYHAFSRLVRHQARGKSWAGRFCQRPPGDFPLGLSQKYEVGLQLREVRLVKSRE